MPHYLGHRGEAPVFDPLLPDLPLDLGGEGQPGAEAGFLRSGQPSFGDLLSPSQSTAMPGRDEGELAQLVEALQAESAQAAQPKRPATPTSLADVDLDYYRGRAAEMYGDRPNFGAIGNMLSQVPGLQGLYERSPLASRHQAGLNQGALKLWQIDSEMQAKAQESQLAADREQRLRAEQLKGMVDFVFQNGLGVDVAMALVEDGMGGTLDDSIKAEIAERAQFSEMSAGEAIKGALDLPVEFWRLHREGVTAADTISRQGRQEGALEGVAGEYERRGDPLRAGLVRGGQAGLAKPGETFPEAVSERGARSRAAGLEKDPQRRAAIQAGAPFAAIETGPEGDRGREVGLQERVMREYVARSQGRHAEDTWLAQAPDEYLGELARERVPSARNLRAEALAAYRALMRGEPVPPPFDVLTKEEVKQYALGAPEDPFEALARAMLEMQLQQGQKKK